ncbi:MAG: alpha/beta hydrolase, partial [Deltaproteobacteria bacterium]|nr:alpha/beta hydrolase [Deltaproteobacteria bacterium]
ISEEQATSLLPSRLVREFGEWKYALDQTILRQLNLEFFSNVADDARQLTCPVLCLRSSHQSIIDDTTWENLAAIIPNATGAIIPQSRHTVMLSAPEAFNARVLDFLYTIGSAGDTWQEF